VVAARERFPARSLTETDGGLWVVRLSDMPSSIHLTHQANLDALGVDDRINTGRIDVDRGEDPDPLLDTCGRLMDAVYDGWNGQPPPIVYRSRSTPSGRNVVFTETARAEADDVGRLREATSLLVYLVMQGGFAVPGNWLG
jgi:hypothetical protein